MNVAGRRAHIVFALVAATVLSMTLLRGITANTSPVPERPVVSARHPRSRHEPARQPPRHGRGGRHLGTWRRRHDRWDGGADLLCGGGGADSLFGAEGPDQLSGGSGKDSCDLGSRGWKKVTCEDSTILAAGDIACDPADPSFNEGFGTEEACRMRATSDILRRGYPRLLAVLMLGDAQYPAGGLADFNISYDPSWGLVKAVTRPVPGNHEYETAGAVGYFSYFGAAAGDRNRATTVSTWLDGI